MWVELNSESLDMLRLEPVFGAPGLYTAKLSNWQDTFIHSGLMKEQFPFAWGDTAGLNVGIVDNPAQVLTLLSFLQASPRLFVVVTWRNPNTEELIYWGDFNTPDKDAVGFHVFEVEEMSVE